MVVDYTKKKKPTGLELGNLRHRHNTKYEIEDIRNEKPNHKIHKIKKAKLMFALFFLNFSCFFGYQILLQVAGSNNIQDFTTDKLELFHIFPLAIVALFIYQSIKLLKSSF